jgi:Bifunctional DNA primase/polymerase, N-terminal
VRRLSWARERTPFRLRCGEAETAVALREPGEVMRQIFLDGLPLHIFPCRADKRPCTPRGHLDAVSDALSIEELWARYPGPLVGVATGAIGGISVVDIDHDGESWFHAHRDELPKTRTHSTRREGWHLIYEHRPGLRCSNSKIAPGIDIKADGGYVIWWPSAAGRVLCDGPVAPFPAWVIDLLQVIGHNGRECSLLSPKISSAQREHSFPLLPTRNLSRRVERIMRVVETAQPRTRNDRLFWAACRLAEIVAEGRLKLNVAEQLLSSAAWLCGLTRDDGERAVAATIRSGLKRGAS